MQRQQKQHGVVQDERGQDQPKDKEKAQKSGVGIKEQREAAERQPPSPGEPAEGE
jgi:hypothetical protein